MSSLGLGTGYNTTQVRKAFASFENRPPFRRAPQCEVALSSIAMVESLQSQIDRDSDVDPNQFSHHRHEQSRIVH